MTNGRVADLLRDVPETAVRLYLGAKASTNDDGVRIELDGKGTVVTKEAFFAAQGVVRALKIRDRKIEYASEVLELRHDAEELFLESTYSQAAGIPKILFVPAGEMASAYYRALIPADTMTDRGLALAHYTTRLDLFKASRYDILWIQLVASPVLMEIARQAQGHGVKIVYDVDDRWDASLEENNPSANLYAGEHGEDVWKMIEMADLTTVSTGPLGKFVQDRAKSVKVLPNLIPASICPNAAPRDPGIRRILWAGSPTHKRDLEIAAPGLRKVLEKNKGKVRFVCFGEHIPEALLAVKQLVDVIPFVEFESYQNTLVSIGADVAIAPLESNDFNASKSAVKFLEYSAAGLHTLMSPVGEYKEIGFENRSLVEDADWENAITWAISYPDEMVKVGRSAKAWTVENRCVIRTKAAPWVEAARELVPNQTAQEAS